MTNLSFVYAINKTFLIINKYLLQKLTGIYTNSYDGALNTKNGFPVFSTVLMANYILKDDDKLCVSTLTDADVKKINNLARDVNVTKKVFIFVNFVFWTVVNYFEEINYIYSL